MSDRLLIRLDAQGGLHWLRQSEDGRALTSSQQGTPPASVLASAGEVIVLVPAADVLLLETQVVARNNAQLQKAVPFAVEDQLLGAVEDQHFAIQAGAAGRVGVAVVAKSRMIEWREKLAAFGIRADRMVPESLAMPLAPEAGSVMIENGKAMARLEPWSAMACALQHLPDWLAQVRAAGFARDLEIHDFDGAALPSLSGPVLATHRRQDALAFLANNLRGNGINLLSGAFAADHRSGRARRWWRRAAMLAAAMVLLVLAQRGLEIRNMQQQIDRADTNMRERLGRTFPDLGAAERARAPQDVMRQRLDGLRGGGEDGGFLAMLGNIAPVIGRTTRSQLRGLEYRNDTLELGLRSPDVATLDGLREQFAAIPGYNAEVTASIPVENAVDGRIRIGRQAK